MVSLNPPQPLKMHMDSIFRYIAYPSVRETSNIQFRSAYAYQSPTVGVPLYLEGYKHEQNKVCSLNEHTV